MQLSTVRPQDIPALLKWVRLFYDEDHHQFDEAEITRALSELAAHPEYGILCYIEHEQKRVGYIIATYGWSLEYFGRDAFIDELYVVPSERNRGYGRAAIEELERTLIAEGIRAVHLEVRAANRAVAMYRRLGYEAHDSVFLSKRLVK